VTGRGRTCEATRRRDRDARVSVRPPGRELDAHAGRSRRASVTYWIVGFVANDLVYATRLPFDPGSPACGAASYVEGCWSPMLRWCHCMNVHAKVTRTDTREEQRHIVEDLSLSGGASGAIRTSQAEHHLLVVVVDLPSETKKATHWVALTCRGVCARSSEHTSRKGRIRDRTGAPDRSYAGTK
jgi:hypothetical protein